MSHARVLVSIREELVQCICWIDSTKRRMQEPLVGNVSSKASQDLVAKSHTWHAVTITVILEVSLLVKCVAIAHVQCIHSRMFLVAKWYSISMIPCRSSVQVPP